MKHTFGRHFNDAQVFTESDVISHKYKILPLFFCQLIKQLFEKNISDTQNDPTN